MTTERPPSEGRQEAWPEQPRAHPTKMEKLYEFCGATSFHGFDLVREENSRTRNVFWITSTLIGGLILCVYALNMGREFAEEKTGISHTVLERPPPLPTIKICYETFLPEKLEHYPQPTPAHVAYFVRERHALLNQVAYASGLWRKTLSKAKIKSGLVQGTAEQEDIQFAHDVYNYVRPSDENLMNRTAYDELMRIAKASNFAELVIKLIPHGRYPLALLNERDNSVNWGVKTYLVANTKEICHHFIRAPGAKSDAIELLLVFPPIFAKTTDIIFGKTWFSIRDAQGILLHRLERPLSQPSEKMEPHSAKYYVAQGRVAESSLQHKYSKMMRVELRLTSTSVTFVQKRTSNCILGREPDPVVHDYNMARMQRVAGNATCSPLDEVFMDMENSKTWTDVCDPWQIRSMEDEHIVKMPNDKATLPPLPNVATPASGAQSETNITESSLNTDEESSMQTKLLPEHQEAYYKWINRRNANKSSENYCETGSPTVADITTSFEPFYSIPGLLGAAFRNQRVRNEYGSIFDNNSYATAFAKPQLAQVRLVMRNLKGDHVLVEQYQLMDLGKMLSLLGGFIGLFIGGSAISCLHLWGFMIEVSAMYAAKYSMSRYMLKKKKILFGLTAVMAALLAGAIVLPIVMKEDKTEVRSNSSLDEMINRALFYNFRNASESEIQLIENCGPSQIEVRPSWLSGETRYFSSPGYPNKYPEETFCPYSIIARPSVMPLRLMFSQFDLETGYDEMRLMTSDGSIYLSCSDFGQSGIDCAERMTNEGSSYLRLEFDSDSADTMQGFNASIGIDESTCAQYKKHEKCSPPHCYHKWTNRSDGALTRNKAFQACIQNENATLYAERLCFLPLLTRLNVDWKESFCACGNLHGTLIAPHSVGEFTQDKLSHLLRSLLFFGSTDFRFDEFPSVNAWVGATKRPEITRRSVEKNSFSWHGLEKDELNHLNITFPKTTANVGPVENLICLAYTTFKRNPEVYLGSGFFEASDCDSSDDEYSSKIPICMFVRGEDSPLPASYKANPIASIDVPTENQDIEIKRESCGPQQPGSINIPIINIALYPHEYREIISGSNYLDIENHVEYFQNYVDNMNCEWKVIPTGHRLSRLSFVFPFLDLEHCCDHVYLYDRRGHQVRWCEGSSTCTRIPYDGTLPLNLPERVKVRLVMRNLKGDHVLVEQYQLMDLGKMLSLLGGFIGLFIGGSAISCLHLWGFMIEVSAMYAAKYSMSRYMLKKKKILFGLTAVMAALLAGAIVLPIVMKEDKTEVRSNSSLDEMINRALFYNFRNASESEIQLIENCGPSQIEVRPSWLSGETRYFSSPGYPNKYPEETFCPYSIIARPSVMPLRLMFSQFDLETGYDEMRLMTSDGSIYLSCSDFGQSGIDCAERMTNEGSSYLRLEFDSDSADTMQGFNASIGIDESTCAQYKKHEKCSPPHCYHKWTNRSDGALTRNKAFQACIQNENATLYAERLCFLPLLTRLNVDWKESFCACGNLHGTLIAPHSVGEFTQDKLSHLLRSLLFFGSTDFRFDEFPSVNAWVGATKRPEITRRSVEKNSFSWHGLEKDELNHLNITFPKTTANVGPVENLICLAYTTFKRNPEVYLGSGFFEASDCDSSDDEYSSKIPICMFVRGEDSPLPASYKANPIASIDVPTENQDIEIKRESCGPQQPGSINIPIINIALYPHEYREIISGSNYLDIENHVEYFQNYVDNMNCEWKVIPTGHRLSRLSFVFPFLDLEHCCDHVYLYDRRGHQVRWCEGSSTCTRIPYECMKHKKVGFRPILAQNGFSHAIVARCLSTCQKGIPLLVLPLGAINSALTNRKWAFLGLRDVEPLLLSPIEAVPDQRRLCYLVRHLQRLMDAVELLRAQTQAEFGFGHRVAGQGAAGDHDYAYFNHYTTSTASPSQLDYANIYLHEYNEGVWYEIEPDYTMTTTSSDPLGIDKSLWFPVYQANDTWLWLRHVHENMTFVWNETKAGQPGSCLSVSLTEDIPKFIVHPPHQCQSLTKYFLCGWSIAVELRHKELGLAAAQGGERWPAILNLSSEESCGGTGRNIELSGSGSMVFLNLTHYEPDLRCQWYVTADAHQSISFSLLSFNTTLGSDMFTLVDDREKLQCSGTSCSRMDQNGGNFATTSPVYASFYADSSSMGGQIVLKANIAPIV